MPMRRYRRRYSRKAPGRRRRYGRSNRRYRRNNKRGARGKRGLNLIRMTGNDPLPRRAIVRMKFEETVNASVTANVTDAGFATFWRVNDVNTPRTGSGYQPYGHDTYESLFTSFRVFAAKYFIKITQLTPSTDIFRAVVLTTNSSISTTNINQLAMMPRAISKWTDGELSNPSIFFSGKVRNSVLAGLTPSQYKNAAEYEGTFGTVGAGGPSSDLRLDLWIQGITAGTVTIDTKIIYYLECFEPRPQAPS